MEIANALAVIIGVSVAGELILRLFDRRKDSPVAPEVPSEPKRRTVRRDWLKLKARG